MARVQLDNGQVLEFDGTPTPQDIDNASMQSPVSAPQIPYLQQQQAAQNQVEKNIGNRQSWINTSRTSAETGHPFKAFMALTPAIGEGIGGTIGDIGLGIQRGAPWNEIGSDINATWNGQRPAAIKDPLQASALPVISGPAFSNTADFVLNPTTRPIANLAGNLLQGGVQGIGDIINSVPLRKAVASTVQGARPAAGQAMEQGIADITAANPGKYADISPEIDMLRKLSATDPEIGNAIRGYENLSGGNKALSTAMQNTGTPNITPSDAQDIYNTLGRVPQIYNNAGSAAPVGGKAGMLDTIRRSIMTKLESQFPDVASVRGEFGETANKVANIEPFLGDPSQVGEGVGNLYFKPRLAPPTVPGEPAGIPRALWGNPVMEGYAKDILGPELFGRLKNVGTIEKSGKLAAISGLLAGPGNLGGYAARRTVARELAQ